MRRLQSLSEMLEAAEAERDALRRDLASAIEAGRAQARRERELAEALGERSHELVRTRRRPLRNLGRYLAFKALKLLGSRLVPLPSAMKGRFARSAAKRDPKRDLPAVLPELAPVAVAGGTASHQRGALAPRADRPTVIIVSHEASRSGAPILALNLAWTFGQRYNIAMISLRGGELLRDFAEASTDLYVAERPDSGAEVFAAMLDAISAAGRPLFAVVNCIESRPILAPLRERGIPSVGLFHEFAANILPRTAFFEAFREADEIVFSSALTIENALEQTAFVRTGRFHVLPQGRCVVPRRAVAEAERQRERDRLSVLLQPNGAEAGEFLVIGAGYVQMRKGVDLFIDVARRVLATPEGGAARFAWIGPKYDPEHDAGYSVYLKDQIERAGLADRMRMVPETSEIEEAYALARVLLLTSRLDPLPNVAIDAMCEGLPVICFEKTTGIANLLVEAGLGAACVADYLDTAGAAARILDLMRDEAAHRAVAAATKRYAAKRFDATAYALEIERLALSVREGERMLDEDRPLIAAERGFDPDFMLPPARRGLSRDDAARFYLTDGRREPAPRRPEAGFNPLVFADAHPEDVAAGRDAYAAFLRRGRPEGPWSRAVIRETDPLPEVGAAPDLRVALHIHAYYPDLIAPIADRLAVNSVRPDLFVSAADQQGLDAAIDRLAREGGCIAGAAVVPNRGRDIGPLLTAFGPALVRNYDVVGHVHTKKSVGMADRALVERWTDLLHETTLGGTRGGAMMDRVLAAFAGDARLGIVFPADPNLFDWSGNRAVAEDLAARLGLAALPDHFDFPMGATFWIRTAALEPFVALELDWKDYPVEPAAYDGTILHAIERLFATVAAENGLGVALSGVTGVTR